MVAAELMTQSYFIDTGKWMVNLPKDESFAGHSLKRTYDGNGNVTSVINNGVVTSFVYFGDGVLVKLRRTLLSERIFILQWPIPLLAVCGRLKL